MVTFTLLWLNVHALGTPGADSRYQQLHGLTRSECTALDDALRLEWAGHFISRCEPE